MLNFILDPMNQITVMWLFSFMYFLFKRKIHSLFIAGFLYYLLLLSPIPLKLYHLITFKSEENTPAQVDGAIILSGGTVFVDKATKEPVWYPQAPRLFAGLNLYHSGRVKFILFTGHDEMPGYYTETESMKIISKKFQIPDHNIITEDESRNTSEHPVFLKKALKDSTLKTFFIVTSQSHMKRALSSFKANGYTVYPYPFLTHDFKYDFLQNYSGVLKMFYYELLGNFYYFATGKF